MSKSEMVRLAIFFIGGGAVVMYLTWDNWLMMGVAFGFLLAKLLRVGGTVRTKAKQKVKQSEVQKSQRRRLND